MFNHPFPRQRFTTLFCLPLILFCASASSSGASGQFTIPNNLFDGQQWFCQPGLKHDAWFLRCLDLTANLEFTSPYDLTDQDDRMIPLYGSPYGQSIGSTSLPFALRRPNDLQGPSRVLLILQDSPYKYFSLRPTSLETPPNDPTQRAPSSLFASENTLFA